MGKRSSVGDFSASIFCFFADPVGAETSIPGPLNRSIRSKKSVSDFLKTKAIINAATGQLTKRSISILRISMWSVFGVHACCYNFCNLRSIKVLICNLLENWFKDCEHAPMCCQGWHVCVQISPLEVRESI